MTIGVNRPEAALPSHSPVDMNLQINEKTRMFKIQGKTRLLVIANFIGMSLYLYFSSFLWAPASQKGLVGGPGDPFLWGISAFPVLLFCFIMNLIWAIALFVQMRRNMNWSGLLMWILMLFT